jgi:23S rRNA (uracil1939-C5)-methyltransferase
VGRKKQLPILRGVRIEDIGSEGNAIARIDEMILFVPGMIPGDVVDVRVTKKKKRYMEGVVLALVSPSPAREKPPCRHFGVCGGCRWQHLPYDRQLFYKAKQVTDNLTRIGHLKLGQVDPILGSDKIYGYRNKLEFTFSERRWLTREELESLESASGSAGPALGFHIPGIFDKVLDINECLLMSEPSDRIRNEVRRYALERKLPFYDFREHRGFLRTMFVRITTTGEVMVVLVTTDSHSVERERLLGHLADRFPEITSLWYVINTKKNDSIADLVPVHFLGSEFITEKMEGLCFRIGPKSFYQTNSLQAEKLYGIVKNFAQLKGVENVYDLYTGTGTIACFLASSAEKVTGIEYIEEAVADARINARDNNIANAEFIAGDIKDIFNDKLFARRGQPDVIITDPPRAGMHSDVTLAMLRSGADRIVYVSCNPATQARDIEILSEAYDVVRIAPVDMFPHTFHVENVALLSKKK